jgi:hypothetical protein
MKRYLLSDSLGFSIIITSLKLAIFNASSALSNIGVYKALFNFLPTYPLISNIFLITFSALLTFPFLRSHRGDSSRNHTPIEDKTPQITPTKVIILISLERYFR